MIFVGVVHIFHHFETRVKGGTYILYYQPLCWDVLLERYTYQNAKNNGL